MKVTDLMNIYESVFEIIGEPKKKGEFTFIEAVKTRIKRL